MFGFWYWEVFYFGLKKIYYCNVGIIIVGVCEFEERGFWLVFINVVLVGIK